MRKMIISFVGGIALALGVAFAISAQGRTDQVERWEFQTHHGSPMQLMGYNAYGNNGWELAAVSCQDNHCAFFFKRRKPSN